ncbi:hypothetical protein [Bdellovibrio svalbardensis]|uniref:Outer membrane protein beta-barrel domain-containing protein n=1 Tax=Bdellovibrio svalbardensis TaxID=2972972 RepID=A0ABT6DKE7_9BACT|nr:hypothetical protein [Bdellovibrio svalbardensis]MDG0817335.1 hypothetical protein [Bdellovibrio svalbardensis]
MKKTLLIASSVVLSFFIIEFFAAEKAHADSALGIVIGDPTGVSGRTSLNGAHSLEGAIAYSFGHYDGTEIHGTYLWDRARSFATKEGPIEMYYGLGARVIFINSGKHDGEVAVGPRAPLGVLYNFHNPNIEVFGEIAATLDIVPATDVDLDLGIGFRVRF